MTAPQDEQPPRPFPRNKDELLRDFTVAGKLRAIRDTEQIRSDLAPKWWETIVALIQFAAALGLIAAVFQLPALRQSPYGRLILFWMALMILGLVMGFEFLISRLHHLRRAGGTALKRIEALEQRLAELEKHKAAPREQDS